MVKTVWYAGFFFLFINSISGQSELSAKQDRVKCGQSHTNYTTSSSSRLICTPSKGLVSVILVSGVTGGDKQNIFTDISNMCNGKSTCNLNTYLRNHQTREDSSHLHITVEYKCLTGGKVYLLKKDMAVTIKSDGFLLLRPGDTINNNWAITSSNPAVKFVVLNCMQNNPVTSLLTQLLNLTEDAENCSLTSCGYTEEGKITLKGGNDQRTVAILELGTYAPVLIYFKGAQDCYSNESVYPAFSNNAVLCTLIQTVADTNEGNGTAVITGDNNKSNGKHDDVEKDDDKEKDDDMSQEKVIIAVVAVVAILAIIVCLAVLLVKVKRKKRKHERPLIMKSVRREDNGLQGPQHDDVNLNDNHSFPGQHSEKNRSSTYLAAPDVQFLDTSLTDAIDLDGYQSDGSRPTSQQALNQVTFKTALERQLTAVSYETAFEGTLEEVVLELARHNEDSDSQDECLSPDDTKNTRVNANFTFPVNKEVVHANASQQFGTKASKEDAYDASVEEKGKTSSNGDNSDSPMKSDVNMNPKGDNSGTKRQEDEKSTSPESRSGSSDESVDNERTMEDSIGESSESSSSPTKTGKEDLDYELAESWSTDVVMEDPDFSVDLSEGTNPVTEFSPEDRQEKDDSTPDLSTTASNKDNVVKKHLDSDYEEINEISPGNTRMNPEGLDSIRHAQLTGEATEAASFEMVENDFCIGSISELS